MIMAQVKVVRSNGGEEISYYDEIIGSGAMKDVYLATDNKRVVAFFREPLDKSSIERLEMIVGAYYSGIFDSQYGDYWKNLFYWPTDIVFDGKRHGIVIPKYSQHYSFEYGSINNDFLDIKGSEKEGKWFSAPTNRFARLDPRERGDWRIYLRLCLMIARGVRRMHAAGLAHSDLSYKNVLISPSSGHACIVDIDGLVVPNKFPPDVVGTPDFIAPEVVATAHLDKKDPKRELPSRLTDRHALAVLIYQYLLLRHPLRGCKIYDINDPSIDETLAMGKNALFIEHPTDHSNRSDPTMARKTEKFWQDTKKLPYTITGPYLSELIKQAFVDGLHNPQKRPTADDWERALIKTVDLIQPCDNSECVAKWYVFDNKQKPICPFCNTPYKGKLPVINLYSDRGNGRFMPDNHRLMIYRDQSIFPWHVNRNIIPNERLDSRDSRRVGYCIYHNNNWLFINERLEHMFDHTTPNHIRQIKIGDAVKLTDGVQLVVKEASSKRLLLVQLVRGS
jgi:serine/threonine protein kinase